MEGIGIGMEHGAGCIVVLNTEDVDRYLGQIREAAAKIAPWCGARPATRWTCSGA